MATINNVSYNVKGMGTPERRTIIQKAFRRLGGDVIFLQETHFRKDRIPRLSTYHYPTVYNSCSPDSKSKGVSILIARTMAWKEIEVEADDEGRWLVVKGYCMGRLFTFIAIYAPNSSQTIFLTRILEDFADKAEGTLVIGGDLNFALKPELDTSKGISAIAKKSLRKAHRELWNNQIVDPWRLLYPETKDFTFYSKVHDSYSRIDYLLLRHKDIQMVKSTKINNITISDHAPISLELEWGDKECRQMSWRLNDSLLNSQRVNENIKKELIEFF